MENFFYIICLKGYDSFSKLHGVFSAARQEYWKTQKPVRVKGEDMSDGLEARYSGRIGKTGIVWKKRLGKQVVEQAFSTRDGYTVLNWDAAGRLLSKTNYSRTHEWRQTAYFGRSGASSEEERPSVVLSPWENQGLTMLEYDREGKKYRTKYLYPCKAEIGTAENSRLNSETGEPEVCASTPEGDFYYCTEEELKQREAASRKQKEEKEKHTKNDLEEIWQPEENLQEEEEESWCIEKAETWKEEKEVLEEEVKAVSEEEKERKEEKEEELPIEKEDEGEGVGKGPAESLEQEIAEGTADLLQEEENNVFLQKDLEEAIEQNPEEEDRTKEQVSNDTYTFDREILHIDAEPVPAPVTRRMVAAKGMNGSIVHESTLKPEEEVVTEAEPVSGLLPAKSIVISAEESYLYFGGLLDGLRHGRGRTQMPNGWTAYEGGYAEDKREGFGVYYYQNGAPCYVGDWKKNRRNGAGVAFPSEGKGMYVGRWEEDQPVGLGVSFDGKGNLNYAGRVGKLGKEGIGVSYDPDAGTVFVGKWAGGRPTGEGSEFGADGSLLYTGGWKDGRREGFGTEYSGNGSVVFVGVWKQGERESGILYENGVPKEFKGKESEEDVKKDEKN